jgi:hypothetical protein
VLYLIGAPFSVLFLLYAAVVALSAYAIIALVSSIDGEQVRRRLAGFVPARALGGILVGLALLTLAQDASGALATALAGSAPTDPLARHVWIADLAVEVPAVLVGGVLLWRRRQLGYVAGAGLLLQYGLNPLGLEASTVLRAVLTTSPLDVATIVVLLTFSAVCFASLAFFVRGTADVGVRRGRPKLGRGYHAALPTRRYAQLLRAEGAKRPRTPLPGTWVSRPRSRLSREPEQGWPAGCSICVMACHPPCSALILKESLATERR